MAGDLTWSILFDWANDGGYATNEAARVAATIRGPGPSHPRGG